MIEELKKIQEREKLTDVQMAARLGIHPSRWNALKNGRISYGVRFITRTLAVYPEMKPLAEAELFGSSR